MVHGVLPELLEKENLISETFCRTFWGKMAQKYRSRVYLSEVLTSRFSYLHSVFLVTPKKTPSSKPTEDGNVLKQEWCL
jgi:hypothetical protein